MFEGLADATIKLFNSGATCDIATINGKVEVPGTTAFKPQQVVKHAGVALMMTKASQNASEQLVFQGRVKRNQQVYLATVSKLAADSTPISIDENKDVLVKDGVNYRIVSDTFRTREEYHKLFVIRDDK